VRAELPSGTVTFLFTDVEGSTRLLHELGPEPYADALQEHRRALRVAFARYEGVEVDTQGDAFFVAFSTADGAVAAAQAAQLELAGGPIAVRMGLHTGTPHLAEEGYVGRDVHLGARVAAAGHGGQVLLSAATHDALEPSNRLLLGSLGEHRLTDFEQPVAIFQLGDRRFPPLKTVANTNLPRPASSFLGREREVAEVVALLRDGARLVALTGPGGTGKTRLAIEAAAELVGELDAGVFWVPLATIRDPRLVVETVAQTLGAADGLAAHIGARELLLVLDNFEQVVEAAPELSSLLEACPNLRLLVTSRELLRIRGEAEYAVPPLATHEAVELFCARSRLDPDETVIELCRRLDNLPLAVELAAARTTVLSPAQIVERLSSRLDLLKGGRDLDPRQQTLRATIEWSYELLSPDEQRLFARLAVFTGGCTLDAAEKVAEADLDTFQSLVEKSLLRHTGDRFWMLETIREFAAEQLERSGDADDVRLRHAGFFLALAESAQLTFLSARHHPELVAPEADNMRAAMSWARAARDLELGLSLARALEMYWVYTNPSEGVRWYEDLLADADDVPLPLRAAVLMAYGSCANPAGYDALAERLYRESFEAYSALGDRQGIAHLLMRFGASALYRDDPAPARDFGEQSVALAREIRDRQTETLALWVVGEAEQRLGNPERGIELIRQSADLAGEIGFLWQRTRMLRRLADRALDRGEPAEARGDLEESLRLSQELGDRISVVFTLARLARIEAEAGDPERAGLLWGAVEAEESAGGLGAWYGERERFAGPLLSHAGEAFDRGRDEGHRLSLDEAVSYALSVDSRS
jgi:predicted ATPase/class 3 adenylate cyclase